MNSIQIKCFLEAARCYSFTKAAEHLFITQPALSKNIAALEKELQLKLFVREPHQKTTLTPAGKLLFSYLEELNYEFAQILEQAHNMNRGICGELKLGILEGQLLDYQLKSFIDLLNERYSEIQIKLYRGSFHELIQNLDQGEMDAIVTLDWELEDREDVECYFLYKLPTKLIVPKKCVLPDKETFSVKDFENYPFISVCEEDSKILSEKIRVACKYAGITPRMEYVSDMRSQILALEMGRGMAGFNSNHMICHSPNVMCVDVEEMKDQGFVLCFKKERNNPCVDILEEIYTEVFK